MKRTCYIPYYAKCVMTVRLMTVLEEWTATTMLLRSLQHQSLAV